jgi:hypothetical protein
MAANLLGLPFELRERILSLCLRQRGTIEIQYPVWADKVVFTQPISQVGKSLRGEAIQTFYRVNVFVWVIDTDEVRSNVNAWLLLHVVGPVIRHRDIHSLRCYQLKPTEVSCRIEDEERSPSLCIWPRLTTT